ncbi:transcriptional regulator, GntR family [Peptostreptococcaceae bacterium oral taxon 113 str. W5053]|nr:transcriptional regulator, GntR family [Peptostreptococcaceae bacterium oral taxon 113 str. W5053]
MIIHLNSEVPIYEQMVREILREIACGKLKHGETLPSLRVLAEDMGINLHTVNKAYQKLRKMGYVEIDRRRGAVIAERFLPRDKDEENFRREILSFILADSINRGESFDDVRKEMEEIFKKVQKGEKL